MPFRAPVSLLASLRTWRAALVAWARRLKRDVLAIYLAARNPLTPWYVRVLALAVAAYALSPIDLIPDFIPVLGVLDDLLLVPLGVLLVVRLLPQEILADARKQADVLSARPVSRAAAVVVVVLWGMLLIGLVCVFVS